MDTNTSFEENKIKNISDEIIKMFIDKKVTYREAREIVSIVLKKIENVEINSSSLK